MWKTSTSKTEKREEECNSDSDFEECVGKKKKQKIKVEEDKKKGDVKKEGDTTKEDIDNRDIEELKLTIGKLQFQKHVLIEQLKLCHEEIMELKDKQGAMSDNKIVTESMIGMGKKRQEIDYIYLGFECQTCRKEFTNDNPADAKGKEKKTTIKVESESMPLENLTKNKLRDVATSPLWKFLDDDQKVVVQNFFNQASKSTIAWNGGDFNIKGIVLEDLMFNKFLSNEIIDWFMSYLRENNTNNAKSKFFHSMCKTFITDENQKNVRSFLEDVLEIVEEDVMFYFFPINTPKTKRSRDNYHWTLLRLDYDTWEWIYFNALLPGKTSKDKYKKDAKVMRDKVTELVNKQRYREGKKLLPTDSPIQVMDCPQQCSPEDSAVYVCKFMQWSYEGKNKFLFEEGNFEEKIQKTRAKFAYKILSDKYRSWTSKSNKSNEI